jgi:D-psicose/D-tagatose/L-ribulose 3-epimerase
LLIDTFHMNIEEKSIPAAILSAAPHIKHFHCSENDRGTVGTGHVPWTKTFQALRTIGYHGWLTVESFGGSVPEIAAATSIWRPLASSQDDLARESLEFIRKEMPHA